MVAGPGRGEEPSGEKSSARFKTRLTRKPFFTETARCLSSQALPNFHIGFCLTVPGYADLLLCSLLGQTVLYGGRNRLHVAVYF
jgi:hypothetical protein